MLDWYVELDVLLDIVCYVELNVLLDMSVMLNSMFC
jgi:hypothetical protein